MFDGTKIFGLFRIEMSVQFFVCYGPFLSEKAHFSDQNLKEQDYLRYAASLALSSGGMWQSRIEE